MLLHGRLAPVHGARRHVVDKLVIRLRKPMLLALTVERDLGPFGGTVGVAEGAGAVLLAFRRPHTLGVTFEAGLLDGGADLLFGLLGQTPTAGLNMISEIKKTHAMALPQKRHVTKGPNGPPLTVRSP